MSWKELWREDSLRAAWLPGGPWLHSTVSLRAHGVPSALSALGELEACLSQSDLWWVGGESPAELWDWGRAL